MEMGRTRIQPAELNLTAGEAFGSGAHPTTKLCLAMLHKYLKPGDRFLDVGTGTGILMIVAARLAAAAVVGFDKYFSVARIARDNLAANRVSFRQGAVFVADSPAPLRCRFDMAAVNILPGTILALLGHMSTVIRPGGLLLCAGMILGNTQRVESGLAEEGFELIDKDHIGLWVATVAMRQR